MIQIIGIVQRLIKRHKDGHGQPGAAKETVLA